MQASRTTSISAFSLATSRATTAASGATCRPCALKPRLHCVWGTGMRAPLNQRAARKGQSVRCERALSLAGHAPCTHRGSKHRTCDCCGADAAVAPLGAGAGVCTGAYACTVPVAWSAAMHKRCRADGNAAKAKLPCVTGRVGWTAAGLPFQHGPAWCRFRSCV
jgi:hypothetical protein